ncbi:protein-L-isoaspartate O-methyltransferase 1-like [Andrographis paniculata]|uniref:protein-L-isoaspartate O-methyltransferase 1-like n=1 Tax=Andrographis paniculata TaxID=175694 RepID=UPI0021E7363D|nr:protein-L-isoaspartate O-methyltransferase 1-like [Andrographis paniculata]XP_051133193.1 protein-L-isoaspartate O-methyltransferase 1-like [Andrographis paniculata]XP_051133194.1 protein-L-isoaspartate O-methyltransferase 1-like [Andrographis paniculata]
MNFTSYRYSSSLSTTAHRLCYPAHPLRLSVSHRRRPPTPPLAAAITAFSTRCYPRFFTRNWLFSRMEIIRRTSVLLFMSTFYVFEQQVWTGSSISKNKQLVEHLQSYGAVRSQKVAEVMEMIDRALFVPEGAPPYVDSPMQIGHNATISAPHMHAMCLELLENHLKPGMCALDVGSGSGYLTACFAVMVGPQGRAVGVEHIPELVESSILNIRKSLASPLLEDGSLSVHVGDGRKGWPECAPYDAIHVGAAAPEIPPALVEQLKPGGRLVIPVGNIFQDLQVVDKSTDGTLTVYNQTSVRYVPLTSREAQIRGY